MELNKITEMYEAVTVKESGRIHLSRSKVEAMDPSDRSMMLYDLVAYRINEMNAEIENLKSMSGLFDDYAFRYSTLKEYVDKINENIDYMIEDGRGLWAENGPRQKMTYNKAKQIIAECDAATRVYNIMLKKLENKDDESTKNIPDAVRGYEYAKIKYEQLFTVLKYKMLEFDVRNTEYNDKSYKNVGKYFVAHNYFGKPLHGDPFFDDEEDVPDVDKLEDFQGGRGQIPKLSPKEQEECDRRTAKQLNMDYETYKNLYTVPQRTEEEEAELEKAIEELRIAGEKQRAKMELEKKQKTK